MSYVYIEYPRHLYQIGGGIKVVTTDDEKAAALAEGWSLTPGGARAAEPDPDPDPIAPETPKTRGRKAKD